MELIAHYLDANAKEHHGNEEGVVNVKAGTFVKDYERGVSATLQERPWQDDTSLSGWFYVSHNPHNDLTSLLKEAATVIQLARPLPLPFDIEQHRGPEGETARRAGD